MKDYDGGNMVMNSVAYKNKVPKKNKKDPSNRAYTSRRSDEPSLDLNKFIRPGFLRVNFSRSEE